MNLLTTNWSLSTYVASSTLLKLPMYVTSDKSKLKIILPTDIITNVLQLHHRNKFQTVTLNIEIFLNNDNLF